MPGSWWRSVGVEPADTEAQRSTRNLLKKLEKYYFQGFIFHLTPLGLKVAKKKKSTFKVGEIGLLDFEIESHKI